MKFINKNKKKFLEIKKSLMFEHESIAFYCHFSFKLMHKINYVKNSFSIKYLFEILQKIQLRFFNSFEESLI